MSNEMNEQLTAAEREIELSLRSLRPGEPGLDPIAVAFRAGAAARRNPSLWIWRSVAAVLAIGLTVSLLVRDRGQGATTPVLVVHPAPRASPSTTLITMEPRGTPSYRWLRERVLDQGLDALNVPIHASPAGVDQPVYRAADTTWRPL